jgi:hypothetical protein
MPVYMTTLVRKAPVSLAIPVYKTSMPTRYAPHSGNISAAEPTPIGSNDVNAPDVCMEHGWEAHLTKPPRARHQLPKGAHFSRFVMH